MTAYLLEEVPELIAVALESVSIALVVTGAVAALMALRRGFVERMRYPTQTAFPKFGRWLLLALEFTLGADVVRTAIAPTWDDIGQLAVIAAVRTFLGFFLERDLERARAATEPSLSA